MTGFLTLEDINTITYSNQNFFFAKIDTALFSDTDDFTEVYMDFCKVTRSTSDSNITYTFEIVAENWTRAFYALNPNGEWFETGATRTSNTLTFTTTYESVTLYLYMGTSKYAQLSEMSRILRDSIVNLNYKQLNSQQRVYYTVISDGSTSYVNRNLEVGANRIIYWGQSTSHMGYLYVNLIKSDFQFQCTQELIVGKVNTVQLGTLEDYLPKGDMIGNNTPTITVKYGKEIIPVTYNSSLRDYSFDIDLTGKTNEGNVHFKVYIEANDVINATATDVSLKAGYETIDTFTGLALLFKHGGTGRLGANLRANKDLTLTKDVYIVGNGKRINLDTHGIIVPSGRILKADNMEFRNGYNTIQQKPSTKVEVTNTVFRNCTGLGSVIDCHVDIASLDNPTDFTTVLSNCTILNCDTAILHGGNLTVTECTVNGKIGDSNYPYFLYQTDGEAEIVRTTFDISNETPIETDIKFNGCIFVCGESAQINGLSHAELQTNNITAFSQTPQSNKSTVDLEYYYDLIEDYITLTANDGYCHAVSGVDYVFKTNVTARRSE